MLPSILSPQFEKEEPWCSKHACLIHITLCIQHDHLSNRLELLIEPYQTEPLFEMVPTVANSWEAKSLTSQAFLDCLFRPICPKGRKAKEICAIHSSVLQADWLMKAVLQHVQSEFHNYGRIRDPVGVFHIGLQFPVNLDLCRTVIAFSVTRRVQEVLQLLECSHTMNAELQTFFIQRLSEYKSLKQVHSHYKKALLFD